MIREMTRDDIDVCFDIQNNSIIHPWTKEMFEDDFKNDKSFYLVNEEEGLITSYVCYEIVLDEATIMSIATNSEYRKKGYANLLLKYSYALLKEKGIKKIFLEVRSTNENAINLYKKNDFKEMSVRKNYYSDPKCDAIVMIKNL